MKYGNNEDWHDWLKMHLMCGVKTHVVTSVEMSGATANDHKRSNVESVFQMIKSKFGERLRSKTETAQVNEGVDEGLSA